MKTEGDDQPVLKGKGKGAAARTPGRTREDWDRSRIPTSRWGRDHWTTVVYAFCCLGSHGGTLDASKMRKKPGTTLLRGHRGHAIAGMLLSLGGESPTRLAGEVDLYGHDDWDCLDDAEAVGILHNVGSGMHPVIHFTPQGLMLGQCLRRRIRRASDADTLTWAEVIHDSGLLNYGIDHETGVLDDTPNPLTGRSAR